MAKSFRITHLLLSLLCATSLILGACSDEGNKPPAAVQNGAGQTSEQKIAALLKLAKAGDSEAQYALGHIYRTGDGVPKDAIKAIEWYQKAATLGGVEA